MGAISFSLDTKLVTALQSALPLQVLVETGTYEGDTVAAALPYFDNIYTVELSEKLWSRATKRFSAESRVCALHGGSPDVLSELRQSLGSRSVVYWLDAHWCVGTDTSGEQSQCPLTEEIAALGQLNDQSVVLIDDARLFTSPPPAPHEVSHWPKFNDIVLGLQRLNPNHRLMIVNDVIAFYPPSAEAALNRYARENGVDWLWILHERKEAQRALDKKSAPTEQIRSILGYGTTAATNSYVSVAGKVKDVIARYCRI